MGALGTNGLKRTWSQKLTPSFYGILEWFCRKRALYKVLRCFDQFSPRYEVTKFWISREWRHTRECTKQFIPGFSIQPFTSLYGRFDHFSWIYEVEKFWMIVSTYLTSYTRINIQNMLPLDETHFFVVRGLSTEKFLNCNV